MGAVGSSRGQERRGAAHPTLCRRDLRLRPSSTVAESPRSLATPWKRLSLPRPKGARSPRPGELAPLPGASSPSSRITPRRADSYAGVLEELESILMTATSMSRNFEPPIPPATSRGIAYASRTPRHVVRGPQRRSTGAADLPTGAGQLDGVLPSLLSNAAANARPINYYRRMSRGKTWRSSSRRIRAFSHQRSA